MAEKNIEMNVMNESGGYDVLYPKTISGNVGGIIYPQATITGEDGIVVTGNNGDRKVSGIIANGSLVLNLPGYGRWNFSYTKDGLTSINFNFIDIDAVKQYSTIITAPTERMDWYSWDIINYMSTTGNVSGLSVGDVKKIILNGTAGTMSWSNQVAYATIIGINHNPSIEGANRIHWQVSLNQNNTYLLGLSKINDNNDSNSWSSSQMRTRDCAQFFNCLPTDLRAVIKNTTKYTGAGNNSSSVISTTDKIFLLSEFEVVGTANHSVSGEANYQAWYEWYQQHNTLQGRIKYINTNTTQGWWERSPYRQQSHLFCYINGGGFNDYDNVSNNNGFAPCFCV